MNYSAHTNTGAGKSQPPQEKCLHRGRLRLESQFLLILIILLSPVTLFAGGGQEQGPYPVEIREVSVFTNGTSMVSYEARVEGSGVLEFHVPGEDMEDVLKTMVVQDLDGGSIASAGFTARDPLSRSLSRLSVDLSGNPGLRDLLAGSPGSRVRVFLGSESLNGTILGLESRNGPRGSGEYLTIMVDGSLRSVFMADITGLRFLDRQNADDLENGLVLLASGENQERKTISIHFSGEGTRRILIRYLRPSPVWKPSYRLLAAEEGALLQGWAVVENTGSADWDNVALTLSTANPVSFLMDLYTPRYVTRPRLDAASGSAAAVPQERSAGDDRLYRMQAAPAPSMAMESMALYEEYEQADFASSVEVQAQGSSSGTLAPVYSYRLTEGITLPAQNSAMVPIIQQELETESYLSYSPSRGLVYRALELTNSGESYIKAGPVAIYDQGDFAGEALLPGLGAGEKQQIEYALEPSVEVNEERLSQPERISSISISSGVLRSWRMLENRIVYRVANTSDRPVELRLPHPVQQDWELNVAEGGPSPVRDGNAYVFTLNLEPGAEQSLELREERLLSQSYQLSSSATSFFTGLISSGALSSEQTAVLNRLVELRNALSALEERSALLQNERSRIHAEQERISRNMENLNRADSIYSRYVQTLTNQEDRLESIGRELGSLESQMLQARANINSFIQSLEL